MFDRYLLRIFNIVQNRKWLAAGLVSAAAVVVIVNFRFISFDNNIELMLPDNNEVRRSIRFLQESNFSDKVILSLKLQSPEYTTQDLISVVDSLALSLQPPMVIDAISGISEAGGVNEIYDFLSYAPQLFDKQTLTKIDQQITPQGAQKNLQRIYSRLLSPGSTFLSSFLRSDPLGISSDILRSVKKLSLCMGYKIVIKDGHFISSDGKHAMLIVETPVRITDGFGSRKLIVYLREKLKNLPDFVSAGIIAGHLHTLGNEDAIKKDVRLTLTIVAAAFLFLFFFLFRDVRAIIIFLIPFVSIIISTGLCSFVLNKLSYFIIGLGAVVAGIAVDYGIHIYMAVRAKDNRLDAVRLAAKPVIVGALTTISVFAAFFFSSVQAYHQLALFSIISIILCLFFALFLLPHFLGRGKHCEFCRKQDGGTAGFKQFPVLDRFKVGCWLVFMIVMAALIRHLSFDNDIKQFDGSGQEIAKAEEEFHRIWGGEHQPAVFIVQGRTEEEAIMKNEIIYREVPAGIKKDNFVSLTALYPSKKTRRANSKRWESFWRQGREEKLRGLFSKYGGIYNFSDDAFSPFFKNLYTKINTEQISLEPAFLSRLKKHFLIKKENRYQMLSFFPDEEDYITKLSAISKRYPGTLIVSRRALSSMLSKSVSSEIIYLSGIAAVLILVLTFLLLKNARLAVLALVPVASGICGMLGVMSAAGVSLNAPSVIAAMVVVGLCIDYGIFMVYACVYNLKIGTFKAVTISALTTLIGAGVLLFARHPVLFFIGITLVSGVFAGYLSSVLVVPSLCRLWIQRVKK